MKIRPVGAELFHVDRRRDIRDEANSLFSKILRNRLQSFFKNLDSRNRSQADKKADGHDLPSRNDCFQLSSGIREELFFLCLL